MSGTAAPSLVRLRDDRVVTVREINPTDAEALVRFHEGLSPDTIRLRYFSAHPHLSQVETVRLTTVDHRDRQAFVAVAGDDIVGVGRYERTHMHEEAEVAFVIADRWQRAGLGSELLRRLIEHARRCGFRRLTAGTLAHNLPMLAVFNHAGFSIRRDLDAGVVDVELLLD